MFRFGKRSVSILFYTANAHLSEILKEESHNFKNVHGGKNGVVGAIKPHKKNIRGRILICALFLFNLKGEKTLF